MSEPLNGFELTGDLAWWARVLPPALAWVRRQSLEGDFAEELARLDEDPDVPREQAQWDAYVRVRSRHASLQATAWGTDGGEAWERELEEIEVSMSLACAVDEWAMILASLAAVEGGDRFVALCDRAAELAEEFSGNHPALMGRVLASLERLREERTDSAGEPAGSSER